MPALGPKQPPIRLVTGVLSQRDKQPEREAHHSLTITEVNKIWLYIAPFHVRWVPLAPQHGASSGSGWKGRPPVGG
jgi:hypothetical protein